MIPLVVIQGIAGSNTDPDTWSIIGVLLILAAWLFVPAWRIGMLVRKAKESGLPLPPTWKA